MNNTDKRRLLKELKKAVWPTVGRAIIGPRVVTVRDSHPLGAELLLSIDNIELYGPEGNQEFGVVTAKRSGMIQVYAPFGYCAALTRHGHVIVWGKKNLRTYWPSKDRDTWDSVPNDEVSYLLDLVSLCDLAGVH